MYYCMGLACLRLLVLFIKKPHDHLGGRVAITSKLLICCRIFFSFSLLLSLG